MKTSETWWKVIAIRIGTKERISMDMHGTFESIANKLKEEGIYEFVSARIM